MRTMIEKLIDRYGTTFSLLRGDGNIEIKGILQIVGAASRQNMQIDFTPLGEVPRGRYLLLVPAEPEVSKGDVMTKNGSGRYFTISRVEQVWFREKTIYCWCLCEERGVPGKWV